MKEILVIAINCACEKETLEYAKNFEKFTNKDQISLCVVDNRASEDSSLQNDLQALDCDVEYFVAQGNLGYMNGCLFGTRMFKEKYDYLPKWIVISNTDISYDNYNFYERFLSKEYANDIWCVGPAVLDNRSGYINPYYKQRLSLKHVNRIINFFSNKHKAKLYTSLSKIKSKIANKSKEKQPSQYVYANHGCFFALRKEFFEALGDEQFGGFLYEEENFVAEIILEYGKKSFYDSYLEVVHNANLVTGKFDISKKAKYIHNSMSYIKRRFYE